MLFRVPKKGLWNIGVGSDSLPVFFLAVHREPRSSAYPKHDLHLSAGLRNKNRRMEDTGNP